MTQPNGKFVLVEAVNPATVCCPEALLATALLSIGVAEHPKFPFSITHEEIEGRPVVRWRWLFAPASADGFYTTAGLIQRWHDPAWLAANPSHEWAILRTTLLNMAEVARRIRETTARIIVRRGKLAAHIPANATPARTQHLLDQLEGRIPVGAPFVEPVAAA